MEREDCTPAPHLPDLVAMKIIGALAETSVFQLVTVAGVCSTWRQFVKELNIKTLYLETSVSLKDQATWPRDWAGHSGHSAMQFRKLSLEKKQAYYEAATRLLRRNCAVFCSGEAIDDAIIQNLANPGLEVLSLEVS